MKVTSKPTMQEFELTTDPDGVAKVVIKQATFAQTRFRNELLSKRRYITEDEIGGRSAMEQDWNASDVMARDIFLTLADASGFPVDDGEELFKFREGKNGLGVLDMNEITFGVKLGLLPDEVVEEIHDCVLRVNPQWGAAKGE
jgi:hypothetical protein